MYSRSARIAVQRAEASRYWPIHMRLRAELAGYSIRSLFDGFEGALNRSKSAKITKCSQDTSLRDIDALIDFGILAKGTGGGRSTSDALAGGHHV